MELNKLIDHTLLKPEATTSQIDQLIAEAKQYQFASVMVNSGYVSHCAKQLKESDIKVATVIGFPLGAMSTKSKCDEVRNALADGANEFDMVLNIGKLKERKLDDVIDEIKEIRALTQGYVLKVIIETCLLTEQEKIDACFCVSMAKADFIKTSTGFSKSGATVEDVALLRKYTDPSIGVKAAGGVRSIDDVKAMVEAGATRIGTSSGVALMQGKQTLENY